MDGWHGIHSRSPLRGYVTETKTSDERLGLPGTVRHVSRIDLVQLNLSDRPIFPFRCIGRRWMVRRGSGVEYSIRRCCRFHPMDDGCSSPSYLGSIGSTRSIDPSFPFPPRENPVQKGGRAPSTSLDRREYLPESTKHRMWGSPSAPSMESNQSHRWNGLK